MKNEEIEDTMTELDAFAKAQPIVFPLPKQDESFEFPKSLHERDEFEIIAPLSVAGFLSAFLGFVNLMFVLLVYSNPQPINLVLGIGVSVLLVATGWLLATVAFARAGRIRKHEYISIPVFWATLLIPVLMILVPHLIMQTAGSN